MAKIIYKKKYKTYISQTLSALIIIGAITVSYLPIDMVYKIIGYAVLFILNFKLILRIENGRKVSDEEHQAHLEKIRAYRYKKAKENLTEEKYNEVKEFIINEHKVSHMLIQRTFDMNYFMADIIVERLHEEGIVSDAIPGSKPREVLIKREKEENK
ncbi:MAG: DNA translocase FtsK [Erysipelotrichaceae bacterium]|nr:DNA translocase FtsK [Erysipelotrichaceae bacterium]